MTPFFYKVIQYNPEAATDKNEEEVGGVLYAVDYSGAMMWIQKCFGNDLIRVTYLEAGMENDIIVVEPAALDAIREAYFKDLC